jgi:beta-lactamase superfamily II metal-dependent hydrolase
MRLERHGVRVLRTDERGTLVVRGRADGTVQVAASR